jgi:hypothetical protein
LGDPLAAVLAQRPRYLAGHDPADTSDGGIRFDGDARDCVACAGRRGETQFVVVASRRLQRDAPLRIESVYQRRRCRQGLEVDFTADAARGAQVLEVCQQAIRHIHAGMRDRVDAHTRRNPRHRTIQTCTQYRVDQRTTSPLRQRTAGITQRAGHPHVVANAGTAATQRATRFDQTVHGDADRQRSARRIAADEGDAVLRGELEEAVEEGVHPRYITRRKGQRQRAPRGLRAHRGEVRQVDRECLPADIDGSRVVWEMDAAVDRVGRDHQLLTGRHLHDGGVIADAQDHIVARGSAAANALDQFELRAPRWVGHDALQRAAAREKDHAEPLSRIIPGCRSSAGPLGTFSASATPALPPNANRPRHDRARR